MTDGMGRCSRSSTSRKPADHVYCLQHRSTNTLTQPILARNRSHRPVHYDELWQSTKASTGTDLSLRTVQRYGKEITRARDKATRAWTAAERTCSYT
jgi:hypothetical protein